MACRWRLLAFFVACRGICFVARVCVIGLGQSSLPCPRVRGLLLQFMCAPLHVVIVVTCGHSLQFLEVLVLCPTLLSLYIISLFIINLSVFFTVFSCYHCCYIIIVYYYYYYYYYYYTELLALCDRCLVWRWVWWVGLFAGLRVGQAFGMFLLPGFGIGSSRPWIPGHPTSICNSGEKNDRMTGSLVNFVLE